MKVWIVVKETDYEGGKVVGGFVTEEIAYAAALIYDAGRARISRTNSYVFHNVEEWEIMGYHP